MIIILPAYIRKKKLHFHFSNFEKKSACSYSSDAKLIIRYEMVAN